MARMMTVIARIRRLCGLALASLVAGLPLAAQADCRNIRFDGAGFTLCEISAGQDLRLFLNNADGTPHGSFARIETTLNARGETLAFAMNAGMYHPDRRPVGLYIEDRTPVSAIVTREGPGNFGMRPNGVFCIMEREFAVIESRAFEAAPRDCLHATQSGPMLVIDGALHPRFIDGSDSVYLRNGVGTSADGQRAVFAISNQPVSFHHFARLYRDHLGLPQALYFDGNVSRLHAPALNRSDWGRPMGPVVGLVRPQS